MLSEDKFYLTKEGLAKLKKEYQALKKLEVLKLRGEVPKTWESEDLNPEYLAYQEDLNLFEARLAELEHSLKNAELIKPPPKDKRNIVHLGARVLVEVDGQKDELEIVGPLEANPALGKISDESPVGKVLLGRKIGEDVVISSPVKTTYKIKKIKYHLS